MNEHWPRREADRDVVDKPRASRQRGSQRKQTAAASSKKDEHTLTKMSNLDNMPRQTRSRTSEARKQACIEDRQPRDFSAHRRPLQQKNQTNPPPMEGSLADHFAVFQARRICSTSQLRHDLNTKETGKPTWDDSGQAAEAKDDCWDNSFGGLGKEIALEKTAVKDKCEKAKPELLVIDFAAPKVQPRDPAEELRKARAEQAAKTAAAWRKVRATYNRPAPKNR